MCCAAKTRGDRAGRARRRPLFRRRRGTRSPAARYGAIALIAGLVLGCAAARAQTAATPPAVEPSLTARLAAFADSLYGTTETRLIGPAREAAEAALGDPRVIAAYEQASSTAQDLTALAREEAAPVWQRAADWLAELGFAQWWQRADATLRDLAARLRDGGGPVFADAATAEHRAVAYGLAVYEAVAAERQRLPLEQLLPDIDALRERFEMDDPLEGMNRFTFRMNNRLRSRVFDPVSEFYLDHTSRPVQDSVHNFFWNLREPTTAVSAALQGELTDAGNATARFAINSTVGLAGLFDPATRFGFPVHPRNLEQTLCVYGLPAGPFVVLPILGPATIRDAVGRLATVFAYYEVMGAVVYFPYRLTDIAVQYTEVRDRMDFVNSISIDPYVAQKTLYLTMRNLACGRQTDVDREFFTN
jgi:phospholipid-binding lipoprotein MlaA